MLHITLSSLPANLTLEDFAKIITALAQLKKLALKDQVPDGLCGICYNLDHLLMVDGDQPLDVYSLVSTLGSAWPDSKRPGEKCSYPVPHNYDYGYWKGPNLTFRLSLIDFMLTRLRTFKRQLRLAQERASHKKR